MTCMVGGLLATYTSHCSITTKHDTHVQSQRSLTSGVCAPHDYSRWSSWLWCYCLLPAFI